MVFIQRPIITRARARGRGLVNLIINRLPFEIHAPGGYQFCGPGTKLQKRLERGDRGINTLDSACMRHDIAYNEHKDLENRHKADLVLLNEAKQRIFAPDASCGEKATAGVVTGAMALKTKLGAGSRRTKKKCREGVKKKRVGGSVKKTKRGTGVKKTRKGGFL